MVKELVVSNKECHVSSFITVLLHKYLEIHAIYLQGFLLGGVYDNVAHTVKMRCLGVRDDHLHI